MSTQLGLFEDKINTIEDSDLKHFQALYPTKKQVQACYLDCVSSLKLSFIHHDDILKNGTSDPSWPDGVNANLVRNHIFYYKEKMKILNVVYGYPFPAEYFIPEPEEINPNAMFNNRKCFSSFDLYWDDNPAGN